MRKYKKEKFTNMREYRRRLKRSKQRIDHELANSEYLAPFKDVIYEEYHPENVSLYRWGHHPNISDDFKPQIFQETSSMSVDMLKEPSGDAPKVVKLEYTSWFTLSNFISLEEAIKAWQSNLGKLLKKEKPDKRDKIVKRWIDKKGQYVMKIDYTEEAGLIGPQGDGIHKEFFPFQDVNIGSLVDRSFQPAKIEIR